MVIEVGTSPLVHEPVVTVSSVEPPELTAAGDAPEPVSSGGGLPVVPSVICTCTAPSTVPTVTGVTDQLEDPYVPPSRMNAR